MAVNSQYYEVKLVMEKDVFYYPFPWPIENDLEVVLYYGEEGGSRTLMNRSYYEVQNGNTVYIDQTFLNEELVGLTLYIQRYTPRTQDLVLHPKSAINPVTLEKALDHLEYQIQELESNSVGEAVLVDFNNQLYLLEQLLIATQQSLNTEVDIRTSEVATINDQLSLLNARIDGMAEMGRYLGTFNTYADIPKTTAGWDGEEGINDFVNVRQDENHGGDATRYIISAIVGPDITWTYDLSLSTDVSGKADKVGGAIENHIASLDSTGNLKDSGVPVSSVGTDTTKLPLAGGQMLGAIDMSNHQVLGVGSPTTDGSAVNRKFLVDYVASTGGGTGGTSDHDKLINRDKDNQHPVNAITGLAELLEGGLFKKVGTNVIMQLNPTSTSSGGGGSGGGVSDHADLTGRAKLSQHPDTAITHGASTVFNVLESQAAAIASKADAADLTNYATVVALNDGLATKANTSHIHSQSDVTNLTTSLNEKASLNSPEFTGTPTVPTAPQGDNTSKVANTEFVARAISLIPVATQTNTGLMSIADKTKLDNLSGQTVNYSAAEQDTGIRWIDGKKIYQKTVDIGQIPQGGLKAVAHGISNIARTVDFCASVFGDTGVGFSTSFLWPNSPNAQFGMYVDLAYINVSTGTARDPASAIVTLFYTCTDR